VSVDVRDFELRLEDARLNAVTPGVEDLGVMVNGETGQRPVKQTLSRKEVIKLLRVPRRKLVWIKARLIPPARMFLAVDERI